MNIINTPLYPSKVDDLFPASLHQFSLTVSYLDVVFKNIIGPCPCLGSWVPSPTGVISGCQWAIVHTTLRMEAFSLFRGG